MAQQNYDIPLHDIKPLLEVQEYSLYFLIALSVIVLLVCLGVFFLLLKWFKQRNSFNIRKEHKKLLQNIDFTDAKHAAYELSFYSATFKDDSPRHREMYKNLFERLEVYKYKKNVDKMDKEVLAYIELYQGMIDV